MCSSPNSKGDHALLDQRFDLQQDAGSRVRRRVQLARIVGAPERHIGDARADRQIGARCQAFPRIDTAASITAEQPRR